MARFAPVSIGDNVILFVNAVVGPGVTIGRDCTVGAGAVVTRDVPDGATAFGNPARIALASTPMAADARHWDEIGGDVLREYAETIPVKGGRVARLDDWSFAVSVHGEDEIVQYEPAHAADGPSVNPLPSITLSAGEAGAGRRGRCHFD